MMWFIVHQLTKGGRMRMSINRNFQATFIEHDILNKSIPTELTFKVWFTLNLHNLFLSMSYWVEESESSLTFLELFYIPVHCIYWCPFGPLSFYNAVTGDRGLQTVHCWGPVQYTYRFGEPSLRSGGALFSYYYCWVLYLLWIEVSIACHGIILDGWVAAS